MGYAPGDGEGVLLITDPESAENCLSCYYIGRIVDCSSDDGYGSGFFSAGEKAILMILDKKFLDVSNADATEVLMLSNDISEKLRCV